LKGSIIIYTYYDGIVLGIYIICVKSLKK